MDKEKITAEISSIANEYAQLQVKCQELEERVRELCPIKPGDKVEIVSLDTEEHLRYAFVRKVSIGFSSHRKVGFLSFGLDKCKKDGTKGNHSDYLGFNERVKMIS